MHRIHSCRSFVLRQAGLLGACEASFGAAGFRIGLIDGAVNTAHPALSDCRILVSGGSDSPAARDHATFGASILVAGADASRAGLAMALCPSCTLISIPVVSGDMLEGRLGVAETAVRLALAVDGAVGAGCRIILFGVAIRHSGHRDWSVLRHALHRAARADILAIIPIGNTRDLAEALQPCWEEVLTVASTGWRGTASLFSPVLGRTPCRAFAPGEDIPGASGDADYVVRSGASGAAAIAAGAVAIGCVLAPGRSPFDVAGHVFPPPDRRLDGAKCLSVTPPPVPEPELSHGA